MPTSTFTIPITTGGVASNDGSAQYGVGVNDTRDRLLLSFTSYINERYNGWLRFTGITIPKDTTITSASLKPYMLALSSNPAEAMVKVDGRQSPGNPVGYSTVIFPPGPVYATPYPYVTGIPTGTSAGTKPPYGQMDIDVIDLVQTMVDAYDYDDGEMVFYFRPMQLTGSDISGKAWIYARDWGTTKAATLVIDFVASGGREPDRTTYRYG